MTARYSIDALAKSYRGATIGIVGNGPSVVRMLEDGTRIGIASFADYPYPMWVVNGGWFYHPTASMGFQMDDLKGPSIESHPNPQWYLQLVRSATIPIFTTHYYEEFPATIAFPLQDCIKYFGTTYFAESINYMIALAIMFGVKEIQFYGADYGGTRPQERAATEYWIGIAHRSGIQVTVSPQSELMKAKWDEEYYMPSFYGYHKESFPLEQIWNPDGSLHVRVKGKLGEAPSWVARQGDGWDNGKLGKELERTSTPTTSLLDAMLGPTARNQNLQVAS